MKRIKIEVANKDGTWMEIHGHGCHTEEDARSYMRLLPCPIMRWSWV